MNDDARANEEVRAEAERLRQQVAELERELDQRKRTEEALREREERFRELADLLPLNVFEIDMQRNFTYANSAGFRMFGYTQSDMDQGVNVAQIIVPEDRPRLQENVGNALRGEDPGNPEYMAVRKDGTTFPILTSGSAIVRDGQVVGVRGFSVDITERKRTEEEQRFHSEITRHMSEGVMLVQAGDGVIVFTKPKFEEIFGYGPGEMLGKHVSTVNAPSNQDPEETAEEIMGILGETGEWHGEINNIRKDGTEFWCQASVSVFDHHEYGSVLISVHTDITERRRMEQQLERAGRLAAVGQLAAGVAHELNNPLAVIQGYAELLVARDAFDDSIRLDVEAICEQAQRAGGITKLMLSFAREYKLENSLGSINEALERTLQSHANRLTVNNVAVLRDLDPRLPKTVADFGQIEQVFMNIIANAEWAMIEANGKGKLVVKTEVLGDTIRITFVDDGPGIAEDKLARIFDPFYTTKEVGQGTGLGLSMSYGIIESHGGQIRVESELGKGSRFIVELPVVFEERRLEEQSESGRSA